MLTGHTAGTMNAHSKASLLRRSRLYVFDILACGGEGVAHLPARLRRALQHAVIRTGVPPPRVGSGVWEVAHAQYHLADPSRPGAAAWLGRVLGGALGGGLEGLVLKGAGAAYRPGGRSWAKLKREHLLPLDAPGDAGAG
eukprot:gene18191-23994_t